MTEQRVRDLTSAPRRLPIDIEGNVTHEIILTMWSAFSSKDTNSALDLGPEWVSRVKELTAEDLESEIVRLGGPYFYMWLVLGSFLLSAPHPHDPEHVFDWLASVDDMRLRRWLLGESSHSDDQALIEQAAGGDMDAVRQLISADQDEHKKATSEMLEYVGWMFSVQGLGRRYADVISRFRTEVFAEFEDEFSGAIARAAAARRAAGAQGDAKSVIEEVTAGIEFDIPLGVRRVVLIPSVVTRPLSLIDEYRGTLVVYYAVADEFIDSDPEAPPSWLVRTYKALSDERRLRILRRLSEGETNLDELTEMLGLSKSTVHHHISILRGAGLVRVRMAGESDSGAKGKCYALRERPLNDAIGFLDSYLRIEEAGEMHA